MQLTSSPPRCLDAVCVCDLTPPRHVTMRPTVYPNRSHDNYATHCLLCQMLFGRRPFGEGKSQERVLSEGIILNATQVSLSHTQHLYYSYFLNIQGDRVLSTSTHATSPPLSSALTTHCCSSGGVPPRLGHPGPQDTGRGQGSDSGVPHRRPEVQVRADCWCDCWWAAVSAVSATVGVRRGLRHTSSVGAYTRSASQPIRSAGVGAYLLSHFLSHL